MELVDCRQYLSGGENYEMQSNLQSTRAGRRILQGDTSREDTYKGGRQQLSTNSLLGRMMRLSLIITWVLGIQQKGIFCQAFLLSHPLHRQIHVSPLYYSNRNTNRANTNTTRISRRKRAPVDKNSNKEGNLLLKIQESQDAFQLSNTIRISPHLFASDDTSKAILD